MTSQTAPTATIFGIDTRALEPNGCSERTSPNQRDTSWSPEPSDRTDTATHTAFAIKAPPLDLKLQGLLESAARTAQLLGASGIDIGHFFYVAATDPSTQGILTQLGVRNVPSLAERILVQLSRETGSAAPTSIAPTCTTRLASVLFAAASASTAHDHPHTRLTDALMALISLCKVSTTRTPVDQMVTDSLQIHEVTPSDSELKLAAILEGQAEILGRLTSIESTAQQDSLLSPRAPLSNRLAVRGILFVTIIGALAAIATAPLLAF